MTVISLEEFARHGATITAGWVVILAGSSDALAAAGAGEGAEGAEPWCAGACGTVDAFGRLTSTLEVITGADDWVDEPPSANT